MIGHASRDASAQPGGRVAGDPGDASRAAGVTRPSADNDAKLRRLGTSWFADGVYSAPVTRHVRWGALAERLQTPAEVTVRAWACPACDVRPGARRRWSPGACACGAELVASKRALPAWSPWTFRGPRRSTADAVACDALVVEYDGTAGSCADVRKLWAGWGHVGHTTWSHQDPAAARVRVVVPLERTIVAAEWPAVWAMARELGAALDAKCSDAGRLWFLPAARPVFEAWHHEGPLLPVPDAPPAAPHHCHVPGCSADVPPRMLMCGRHWRRVPVPLQRAVWAAYRSGQEVDKRPSAAWLEAADKAIAAVRNGDPPGGRSRGGGARRYPISERWRTDAAARRALGLQLGGQVAGEGERERICRAPCPRCGAASVMWWVHPQTAAAAGARCDHEKTCGWYGWLDQLAGPA